MAAHLPQNIREIGRRFGPATLADQAAHFEMDFAEINTKCCPQIDSQHDAKLDGTTREKSKLKSATGNPAFF